MENPSTEPPTLPAGTDSKQVVVASTDRGVSEVTTAAAKDVGIVSTASNNVQPQTTSNQISLFPIKYCLKGIIYLLYKEAPIFCMFTLFLLIYFLAKKIMHVYTYKASMDSFWG